MPTVELLHGDCIVEMGALASASVDLVVCDLPYGVSACPWDSVIPFAPLWAHYRRLIKPTGAIVLTATQPFTSALVMSNLPWFKYALVWEKERGSNFLNAKHQPLKVHEDIVVFAPAAASHSPRGTMAYYPQMAPGEAYKRPPRSDRHHQYHTTPTRAKISVGGRFPRSVMRFNTERGAHGTQKPVEMMEYLIRTYTAPGDLVLDNAMGSGSTGVACVNAGRRFVGIEISGEYFRIASDRIAGAVPDLAVREPETA